MCKSFVVAAIACACAFACTTTASAQGARPPEAPAVELETRLDAALTGANDPAARWLRGLLTRTDDEARARDLAAAHEGAPQEMLYLATLAEECQVNRVPRPEGCARSDWLARWAAQDPENAAPWVMLAERSLRVRQPQRALADLQQASARTRWSEYGNVRVVRAAAIVQRLLPAQSGTAAWLASFGEPLAASRAAQYVCTVAFVDTSADGRTACIAIATHLQDGADTIAGRQSGATIALHYAADDGARTRARRDADRFEAMHNACGEWLRASVPAPAIAEWLNTVERSGEAAACERYAR